LYNYFLLKCTHTHQVICLQYSLLPYIHSFITASLKWCGNDYREHLKSHILKHFHSSHSKLLHFLWTGHALLTSLGYLTYWSWCAEYLYDSAFKTPTHSLIFRPNVLPSVKIFLNFSSLSQVELVTTFSVTSYCIVHIVS